VAVDDGFVVNGQKVWTTIARDAQWGILLARTDPDAPKHRGLSFFLCDMSDPGIEIRPIKQLNGSAEFNEVFLTDVRIPRDRLVGDLHRGWDVAIATLEHERIGLSLAPGSLWGTGPTVDDLVQHLSKVGAWDDAVLRDRGARIYAESVAHRMLKLRLVTEAARGREPGAKASIQKLFGDEWGQRVNELAVDAQGLYGLTAGFWQDTWLFSQALTIGGGTTEVQKNIIGERLLGLPKEPALR
jgi:alkylation response protein AidB-like acyl-CoA dehydrogenase